jgi:signal transduction histidine kinase
LGGQSVAARAWGWLASFRRRIVFRAVFLFLIVAIIALALALLRIEKQRNYQSYQGGLSKTHAQILTRLTHPAGQLALLNADRAERNPIPLRPYVLPYAALDYDDVNKVQQAVDTAGCYVTYGDGRSVCVAIGSNPFAGGFVYVAGRFTVGPLVTRPQGERNLQNVHRFRVTVDYRGSSSAWTAPYERMESLIPSRIATDAARGVRGRLTGFTGVSDSLGLVNPVRDFRGWIWQSARCLDGALAQSDGLESGCERSTFYSMRLPIESFEQALQQKNIVWPPTDLDLLQVRLQILAPEKTLFDSNEGDAKAPFSLQELSSVLLAGESLEIRKNDAPAPIAILKGAQSGEPVAPWIERLVRRMPLGPFDAPLSLSEPVSTAYATYTATLQADVRGVHQSLASAATRMSWFVGAMLLAVLLAWAVVEIGVIKRLTTLHKRARMVTSTSPNELDVSDLRGQDELGSLAVALDELLTRVKESAKRDQLRTEHERETWQAVGHEIMSPLQSLMVLHSKPDDPSARYIARMQNAVRVLYGQASPSEAFAQSDARLDGLNLTQFLRDVAQNAEAIGIPNVVFSSEGSDVFVNADAYMLEDVVTHILQNAQRYRTKDSPISIALRVQEKDAIIDIQNDGLPIDAALIDRIFEYGVSDPTMEANAKNRGQGLYVVKTYMTKMHGRASAHNVPRGVCFTLTLPYADRSR